MYIHSGVFRGGPWCDGPPPLWPDHENFLQATLYEKVRFLPLSSKFQKKVGEFAASIERSNAKSVSASGGPSPPDLPTRGRAPGRGIKRAKPPWSWNTFCFWMFNGSRKFAYFFLKFGNAENHSIISDAISHGDFNCILYRYEKRTSNIVEFCNSCWKMAKNAPFHMKSP